MLLFGQTAASRAKETGTSERTLHYKADQFEQEGMVSLFPNERTSTAVSPGRNLPEDLRQLIVDLRASHSGFTPHEIATICFLRFERRPSDHTVKRVIASGPKSTVTRRRYPPYAQIADPYQRRRAIVDLHAEGWSNTAISAYLPDQRARELLPCAVGEQNLAHSKSVGLSRSAVRGALDLGRSISDCH